MLYMGHVCPIADKKLIHPIAVPRFIWEHQVCAVVRNTQNSKLHETEHVLLGLRVLVELEVLIELVGCTTYPLQLKYETNAKCAVANLQNSAQN